MSTFWTEGRLLRLTLFCMAAMLIALGLFFYVLDNLHRDLEIQRQISIENRAMVCTVQLGLEIDLPESCLNPAVSQYFDPEMNIGNNFRTSLKGILCFIAQAHNGHFPQTCGE